MQFCSTVHCVPSFTMQTLVNVIITTEYQSQRRLLKFAEIVSNFSNQNKKLINKLKTKLSHLFDSTSPNVYALFQHIAFKYN